MDIKKTFGEKIKRLRKAKNLTQEQLAEMINIAPKNLSKIEVEQVLCLQKLLIILLQH